MNTLLLFFALPIATIILAIVLEKIIDNPILTAATFFAIYLVATFSVFDESFLIYAIVYTILAYIAAYISTILLTDNDNNNNENGSCNCCNARENVTANITNNFTGQKSTWNCYRRN